MNDASRENSPTPISLSRSRLKREKQSTITEKMAAVHFPSNALRPKIYKKANGCLLKDECKRSICLFC